MNIVCPQCGFSRDVNPERFAKGSVIANCPQCGCRFRVSAHGVGEVLPPKVWHVVTNERPTKRENELKNPEPRNEPPEEEDIRLVASRAYQKEANRFKEEEGQKNFEDQAVEYAPNPWEIAPENSGWINAFYQTVSRVMFAANIFFRNLPAQTQQARPLIFYLLIAVFQTLVERFWGSMFYGLLTSNATGDPQLEKMLAMLAPESNIFYSLLLRCALLVLQLYVLSFLMCMVYKLVAPQKVTFSLLFQIWCYSSAPSLLCVIPVLGSLAGLFWGVGCLAIGCKVALKLNWPQTLVGFLPLVFVFAPLYPELMSILHHV